MGTANPTLSEGFAHPSPALIELVELRVGTGSVGMAPVWVYCGRVVTAPALLRETGGQEYCDETEAAIWPAPEPPVCEGASGGCHVFVAPQTPTAERGSVGIHPLSRPSLYDHAGDSTLPLVDELPIFHVQKNQFYEGFWYLYFPFSVHYGSSLT